VVGRVRAQHVLLGARDQVVHDGVAVRAVHRRAHHVRMREQLACLGVPGDELDRYAGEQHHALLSLQPLAPAVRDRYQTRWDEMQSHFVDRPQVAVADADSMITQVMRDLGYPVDDFESNAWLISVEHANVVAKYREGHDIYTKTVEGRATTEDLRQAVLAYRALFEELMRDSVNAEQRS